MRTKSYIKLSNNLYIPLEKARSHKYYTKKPDGKGGWIYTYKIISYNNNSFTEENLKKINYFIENIRDKETEHSGIYDKKGNLILYKKGNQDSISYSKEEIEKIKNSELLIHNHSNINSFSLKDIEFLLNNNINQMMVCIKHKNQRYNYVIQIKKQISEENKLKILLDYQNDFERRFNILKSEFLKNKKIDKNKLNYINDPSVDLIIKKYGEYFGYKKF